MVYIINPLDIIVIDLDGTLLDTNYTNHIIIKISYLNALILYFKNLIVP